MELIKTTIRGFIEIANSWQGGRLCRETCISSILREFFPSLVARAAEVNTQHLSQHQALAEAIVAVERRHRWTADHWQARQLQHVEA
jgi:hypothetical protein